MSNAEVKVYLLRYRDADRGINAKLDELTRLRSMACKTTQVPSPDRVQTSVSNHMEAVIGKIVDLEAEINTEIDRLRDIRREVTATIGAVPDASQRAVLRERYISGRTWEQIAVDLHYNYRWVLRLHGRALSVVQQAIESHCAPVL